VASDNLCSRPRRRRAGSLEDAALGAADEPLGPADVQAALVQTGIDVAYTTVATTLARLHRKGHVERLPGPRGGYRPTAGSADAAAWRMRALLGTGGRRDAVLSRFVDGLSPDEEQLLTDLLRRSSDSAP